MDMVTVKTLGLLFAMGAFFLISWWAYSPRNKRRFEEDAMLPLVGEKQPRSKTL